MTNTETHTTETEVELLHLNAYGARWHVTVNGRIIFSAQTKHQCIDYCRRRGLKRRA